MLSDFSSFLWLVENITTNQNVNIHWARSRVKQWKCNKKLEFFFHPKRHSHSFFSLPLWSLLKKGKHLIKLNYNFSIHIIVCNDETLPKIPHTLSIHSLYLYKNIITVRLIRKFNNLRWIIKFLIYIFRHSSFFLWVWKPWASDTQWKWRMKKILRGCCWLTLTFILLN